MGSSRCDWSSDDGRLKSKTFYRKTRKEASDKLNKYLTEIEQGTYIEPCKITVSEWLDEWYSNYVINSVKISTRVSYEMIIRQHLKPNFGFYKLKDLKSSTIQGVYNKLLKDGRADGKGGLSQKTIQNIHRVFRKALQLAYINDMIAKNPAGEGRITLPKQPVKKKIRVFSVDEQKAIEKLCGNNDLGMAILLDLYTGMRRGELLALTWNDIDFKKRTITINKQLNRLKNFDSNISSKTILQMQPYTKNSQERIISVSTIMLEKLKNYKIQQSKSKITWDDLYNDKKLVFCREDGNYLDPKTFEDFFKKTLKLAGVENTNVHALRHTFATRALESNIPVKVVSKILGHANIQITLDTYTHVLPELQEEAMQIIADKFLNVSA